MIIQTRLRSIVRITLACVCAVLATTSSRAQCVGWKAGPQTTVNGQVEAMVSFDPDGSGGNPPVLVIGGQFSAVGGPGGAIANNVAGWTGSGWQVFGSGLDGEVKALAVFNSQLYAAGSFKVTGNNNYVNIARWNGSIWEVVGGGFDHEAHALTVYNGQLIVGGEFDMAGTVAVNHIAAWDGVAWHALGAGLNTNWVNGLAIYNGELIAVGTFYSSGSVSLLNVGAWNGTSWHALGSGVDSGFGVWCATVLNGELVVAGDFEKVGGRDMSDVAVWNGTEWHGLGEGLTSDVETLSVYNGQLIAGGYFNQSGGTLARGVARWSGTAWLPLSSDGNELGYATVFSLFVFNGQLAVGGFFGTAAGQNTDGLAFWDSTSWHPSTGVFFYDGVETVTCSANWFGQALLGGSRSGFYSTDLTLWDGANYTIFPGEIDGSVYAVKTYTTGVGVGRTDHLVVGGTLQTAYHYPDADVAASNIVSWDQSETAAFPAPGWHPLGPGVNAVVHAVERYNNTTIAAGDFTATGNGVTALSHIGQWNGTAWSQLGTGLDGQVFALKVFNGSLYAGGSFTHANNGAIDTGGLARWDGAWHAVGGHFAGTVYALEVHNGSLVIAGVYPGIGGSPNIARYDGTSYYAIAPGGGANGPIYSLLSYQNWLYAGGTFSSFAGASVHNIARWNGSSWSDVQGGTNGVVNTMLGYGGEVIAGGLFSTVNNGTIRSAEFARFADPGTPFLADQPSSHFGACFGSNPIFSVTPATHYDNLTYTWRKNGTPLTYGTTPWSSYIATNGRSLQIANVASADAGMYDVVVSNACGSVTSVQATLTICAPDFNCSGQLAVDDIFAFLSAFFAGDPRTDFNRSDGITVQDVFDFLNAWFVGC